MAQAKLKSATESDSESLSIARAQEVLALLGYAPGPADGITGSATRLAMKKAATDLRLSVPDDSDTTGFARALETELTKRVRIAQEQLAARGYDPGKADGHLGPRTRKDAAAVGLRVDVIARERTAESLIDAVVHSATALA